MCPVEAPPPVSIEVRLDSLRLRVLEWRGATSRGAYLLLHGLASNARFWEPVAARLAAAGYSVWAPDLRGHGQSDKPDDGYDFATLSSDVVRLAEALGLGLFVLGGHSWGGMIALDVATRHDLAGIALVDGGIAQVDDYPDATWERTEQALTPPRLAGTPLSAFRERLAAAHPDWPADVPWQEIVLANFEVRSDGTIAPHLTFERHMRVVRAIWEYRTYDAFDRVRCPVLMVAAQRQGELRPPERAYLDLKRRGEAQARRRVRDLEFVWMDDTDHDIPLHRPHELADVLVRFAERVMPSR